MYNKVETEILNLWAATESVGDMVNHQMFNFHDLSKYDGVDEGVEEAKPISEVHLRYFLVLFIDFVAQRGNLPGSEKKVTCLDMLRTIGDNPQLGDSESASSLKKSVSDMDEWLEGAFEDDKIWLPNIDLEATLKVSRKDLIFICGNVSKHSAIKLTGVRDKVKKVLKDNGHPARPNQLLSAVSDMHEWFFDNQIYYYAQTLAKLVNNIAHGINDYCEPIYSRLRHTTDEGYYTVRHPQEIKNDDPAFCFQEIVNRVFHGPFKNRFDTLPILTKRYGGEE